jgi:hypothetical protein
LGGYDIPWASPAAGPLPIAAPLLRADRRRGGFLPGRLPGRAGALRAEDLIVAVDGRKVAGVGDVQHFMVADLIGQPVEVTVVREGSARRLSLTPAELTLNCSLGSSSRRLPFLLIGVRRG